VSRFDWLPWRPLRRVTDFSELPARRVEVEGIAEALDTLIHPITGEPCIALEYSAAPPSVLSVHGAPHSARAFTVKAIQAVDFVLFDGTRRLLVRVGADQDDVALVHEHLLEQHGLRLRVEIGTIRAGARVLVRGRAMPGQLGPAYRSLDYVGELHAESFRELVE
jgi:hypothetical protein